MLVASGLGLGRSPVAPGTVGSLWGLPLAWAIYQLPIPTGWPAWLVQLFVLAFLFVIGVPICGVAASRLGKKDPAAVVYDEIVTIPIVFFLLPLNELNQAWVWVAGFLAHRVFDILKPPPARQLEHLPAGWGIMADDVAAAVYGCCAVHLLVWLVGRT